MRFIPAGAGNTHAIAFPPIAHPVYPRWRGEHRVQFPQPVSDAGLSPLARGTHVYPYLRPVDSRFIPAGAGNTPERGNR